MPAMAKFQPSPESRTPRDQALGSLRYAKAAIERLEKLLEEMPDDKQAPSWAMVKIHQGASSLGMALSALAQQAQPNPSPKKKGARG